MKGGDVVGDEKKTKVDTSGGEGEENTKKLKPEERNLEEAAASLEKEKYKPDATDHKKKGGDAAGDDKKTTIDTSGAKVGKNAIKFKPAERKLEEAATSFVNDKHKSEATGLNNKGGDVIGDEKKTKVDTNGGEGEENTKKLKPEERNLEEAAASLENEKYKSDATDQKKKRGNAAGDDKKTKIDTSGAKVGKNTKKFKPAERKLEEPAASFVNEKYKSEATGLNNKGGDVIGDEKKTKVDTSGGEGEENTKKQKPAERKLKEAAASSVNEKYKSDATGPMKGGDVTSNEKKTKVDTSGGEGEENTKKQKPAVRKLKEAATSLVNEKYKSHATSHEMKGGDVAGDEKKTLQGNTSGAKGGENIKKKDGRRLARLYGV